MSIITIDPTYKPRIWRCEECRTILGIVLRNSYRVRSLWILRVQIKDGALEPTKDQILREANSIQHDHGGLFLVRSIDSAQGVGCNTCGSLQEWYANEEAMIDLIRRMRGENGVKEYRRLMQRNPG